MNLCVISEYTCTFDDFEKMVEENQNEEVITDHLLTKVNDHKSVLLLNCVDMEAFQALMTSAEMKQWDEDNIFMEDLDEWPAMNEVYKEYFPTDPPARRTVQAKLIEDYRIEIDCVALE